MIDESRGVPDLKVLLDEPAAEASLQNFGFADWKAARSLLQRMASADHKGLSDIYSFLMVALGSAADPDRSLVNFERLMDSYGPKLFTRLKKTPRVIEILITIFSASPFLTEILLRTPDALELLNDRQALTERKTIDQFQTESLSAANSADNG